jgi:hypothetical protein
MGKAYAMLWVAGEIAEWMCQPEEERGELGDHLDEEWWDPNPRHDFNRARQALEPFEPDKERRDRWLTQLVDRTWKLLAQPNMWSAIKRFAGALLLVDTLEGEALCREVKALKIPRRRAGNVRKRPVSSREPK